MSHFPQGQASGPWGLRPGGEIKGLRGDVHVVRRTKNPADLSASGGLTLRLRPLARRAAGSERKGPFLDGN